MDAVALSHMGHYDLAVIHANTLRCTDVPQQIRLAFNDSPGVFS